MGFDGSNKGDVGCGQNIAYHLATSPDYENLKSKIMAKASPEAIAYLDPLNYQGPKVIVDASMLTPEEWQAMRKNSIGSSAASHVFGDSPYPGCTNLDLYNEKVGVPPTVVESEEDRVRKELLFDYGHRMEGYLQKYTQLHWPRGQLIIDTNVYADPQRPFLTANLDGMLRLSTGEYVHIEYKTTSEFGDDAYKNGAIPPHYKRQLIQCQHIMGVWKSYLIVALSRDKILVRSYERDLDEEMEQIIEEEDFWVNHVLARIPPEPKGPVDNIVTCIKKYEQNNGPVVNLDPMLCQQLQEAAQYEAQMASLRKELKLMDELRKKALVPVMAAMGASESATATDGKTTFNISWKPQAGRKSCDYERLKLDYPEIYDEYVTEAPEGPRPMKVKSTV